MEWHSLQAGETDIPTTSAQSEDLEQETVEFADVAQSFKYSIPSAVEDLAVSSAMTEVSLAQFLSRPVRIFMRTWSVSDAAGSAITSFKPWKEFFNNTPIKYKLNNWAFIRCDLKLKILINASPFYFGAAMMTYQPCTNFAQAMVTSSSLNLITYSQRPRVMLYPQSNEGAEMTLPFFWPNQFARCSVMSDFDAMGQIDLHYLTQLVSATGVSGAGISFQVFAWAENVTLCGPTAALAMQAKDEYAPNGVVSAPASAIAAVANRMSKLPIIGKFAKATEIGASATSKIAKLYGFTDVPQIGDVQAYQPRAVPAMSTTEIGFPTEKLTIDPKNELSVDPAVAGLASTDELAIESIAQKESYLTQFAWSTANAPLDLLFNTGLCPSYYYNVVAGTQADSLLMTPLAWLGTMFGYWRGDIILRFRFIASQYHKGRVRISYDPTGASYNDAYTESVVMTKIVDLSVDTDVEMRIPFSQYVAWCGTHTAAWMNAANLKWGTSASNFHEDTYSNGCLTIRCATALSAPVAVSTVRCLVFVRGAENIEFAAPSLAGTEMLSMFSLQASEEMLENKGESGERQMVVGEIVHPNDHLYLTYMGEAIRSLRTLMRRKSLWYIWNPRGTSTNYNIEWFRFYRSPFTFGYDTNGIGTAKGLITPASNFNFNWTHNNYLTYISGAFVGNRGSVNYIFSPVGGTQGGVVQWLRVYRNPTQFGMGTMGVSSASEPTNMDVWNWTNTDSGASGQALGTYVNNVVTVSVPMYSTRKFAPTSSYYSSASGDSLHDTSCNMEAEIFAGDNLGANTTAMRVPISVSAGTDYTCLFFLNVPIYRRLNTIPAS